jgi:Alpha/beta hydrolase domain
MVRLQARWPDTRRRALLPDLQAPVAQYRGRAEAGSILASLTGSTAPFSDDTIRSLYPTREAYFKAYSDAVDRGIEAGFLLPGCEEYLNSAARQRADELTAWDDGHA